MDIEQFYDADPRRRASEEIELGKDWHDQHGVRYELSWIADTGEIYVMREPVPDGWATPFGGVHVRGAHSTDQKEQAGMTVTVLGIAQSSGALESMLAGWESAMGVDESISWLVDRLREHGVLEPGTPSSGPDDH